MKKLISTSIAFSILILPILGAGGCPLANSVHPKNNIIVNNASISMFRRVPHNRHKPTNPTNPTNPSSPSTNVTLPTGTQESENWAGYAVTPSSSSESYTSLTGTWTVPTITSSNKNALASQWIGLGGVNSDDLLQIGTVEEFQGGKQVNEIFWEKLPETSQNVTTVSAGSVISASISRESAATGSAISTSTWDLTVNISGSVPYSKTITVKLNKNYATGIGTSAEWISEDPSNGNGNLYPLANMGTISYTNATANNAAINTSGNTVEPIALVNQYDSVLIVPSALGSDEESFTTYPPTTSTSSATSSLTSGKTF